MSLPEIGDWLFSTAPGVPGLWYLGLVGSFGMIFGASVLTVAFRRSLFPSHSLKIRLARRFGSFGVVLGGIGLFLLMARYLDLGFLQMRFLLLLAVVGAIALAAFFLWFARARYPALLAAHEVAKARDRFVRPGAHSSRRRERRARR